METPPVKDSDGLNEFLTITMIATPDGALLLRSVEFIAPTCRARFSFGPEATVEKTFSPLAGRAFKSLAERIVAQRGMLSLPDVSLDLDGLVLGDCRIVATDARDDGAQILVRFRDFAGDIFILFAEDCEIHQRVAREPGANEASLQLFEKAYMPLNDVAEHIMSLERELGEHQIGETLVALARRIKALDGVADAKRISGPQRRALLH